MKLRVSITLPLSLEDPVPMNGNFKDNRGLVAGLLLILLSFGATATLAETPANPFLRTEYQVLGDGASQSWTRVDLSLQFAWQQVGGDGLREKDEVGGVAAEEKTETEGPSNTGEKIKVGVMSALIPGTGQLYNGDKKKGYIMLGAEAAIWTAYIVFDQQGDSRMESAQEYAGIYAGASGTHTDSYWQSVGRYMDSDAYNESLRREARALDEPVSGLVTGSDTWQWANEDRRSGYSQQRADGNSAYDRRDFMILFAVVNRAVSVVDAVIGVGDKPGVLEAEVLGMNIEMGVTPSWRDPGARCVVSRSF